jgi:CHAT domain-containing protein
MILEPARAQLDKRRWIIIADGGLQRFPFGALPEPESAAHAERASALEPATPVLLNHETVYSPSASLLAVLREGNARRVPPTKLLAVFADPVFRQDDSRLTKPIAALLVRAPSGPRTTPRDGGADSSTDLRRLRMSEEEARAIAAMAEARPSLLALGVDATRAQASGANLEPYRYVHFATHGLLDDQHPHLSSLVLSLYNQKGEAVDGYLRMHEIYGMKLSADLVVLSACDTGLGKEVKGEGLMALTRGFMYAGAARVVASMWKVDDTATSLLMQEFYRQLIQKSLTPAAALTEAQRSMWRNKRWRAPYYWAAFVLQGEYQ